jgi:hypothetical protein
MIAIRNQRRTANFFANFDAQPRHSFITEKAEQSGPHHGAKICNGLRVEQVRERLIARDHGTAEDQTDDDDTCQVFRTTQAIGEPW